MNKLTGKDMEGKFHCLIGVGRPSCFVLIRYVAGTDETKTKTLPPLCIYIYIYPTNPRSEITVGMISELFNDIYATSYFRRDDKNEVMNDN